MKPKSWEDISVEKYYKLYAINKVADVIDQQVQTLACLLEVDDKEVERMTVTQVVKAMKPFEFLKELPDGKPLTVSFQLEGKRFKSILISSDMTAAQFIDFSSIGKNVKPDDLVYEMHKLIAAMCQRRKIKGCYPFIFYEYEGFDKNADLFLKLPMSIAYPFYVFFCNVSVNLQTPILNSLEKMLKKETKEVKKLLKRK